MWLHQIDEPIECLFCDPPDNIGLAYGEYDDKLPDHEYIGLLEKWIELFVSKAPTVWFSFNARWTVEFGWVCNQLKTRWAGAGLTIRPCVQTFTFGSNRQKDFVNGHRPLWRFQRSDASLYPDDIRVESWRQQHGDKRASDKGKVPDDVFDFPRVTGNSEQRRPYHPTQLHEGLVERCIRFTTQPGQLVVDPFAGTGTTLRVCRRIGRQCALIDVDRNYCKEIAKEHGAKMRERGKYARWLLPFNLDEKYTTTRYDGES